MITRSDLRTAGLDIALGRTATGKVTRGIMVAQAAFAIRGTLANPVRMWKYGGAVVSAYTDVRGILPALGPDHKVGVRYGGTGRKPFSEAYPLLAMNATPAVANLPVPSFGLAITAVPGGSSRLGYEQNKSRPGQAKSVNTAVRMTTMRKSMRGASAQKPGGMISPANRRGPASSRERRPRTVRYRKGGCPPGYRYDRRRRMCVLI